MYDLNNIYDGNSEMNKFVSKGINWFFKFLHFPDFSLKTFYSGMQNGN